MDKVSLFLSLQVMPPLLFQPYREAIMKTSDHYRKSAGNCVLLAEGAVNETLKKRYKRMEAAWRAYPTSRPTVANSYLGMIDV
jgi:hypothetical protein